MVAMMTENMFQNAKEDFENKLKTDFEYDPIINRFLREPTKEDLLRVFEDAVRDTFVVQVVSPHSFPVGLVGDDYYGADEKEGEVLPKEFDTKGQSGTDGDC